MPPESQSHWGVLARIHELRFNHQERCIHPAYYLPPKKTYGLVTVDLRIAIAPVAKAIQDELDTVKPYLDAYINTKFDSVTPHVEQPNALGDPTRYLRELWIDMIRMTGSASEVACMVVAILLAKIHGQSKLPEHDISEVLNEAKTRHPLNFLIQRLTEHLEGLVKQKVSPGEVTKYLEQYLEERVAACNHAAQETAKKISPKDDLIIYGYSRTIMSLITRHLGRHQGTVYIVRCRRNEPELIVERENERIADELKEAHIEFKYVEIPSLRELFFHLHRSGRTAKVLIGARGVFGSTVLTVVVLQP